MSRPLTTANPTTEQGWAPDLLKRYDCHGPRYTSYPGAQMFSEQFNQHDYTQALQSTENANQPLSLYVHIPFCENICYYCACNKIVTRDTGKAQRYLDYLYREITLLAENLAGEREVNALHLGGGTPTFLNSGELTELIYHLSKNFHLSSGDNREFSIEIDPRTVNAETVGLLKGLGFNRLSMGIQDFDPAVQKAINRNQSLQKVRGITLAARDFGFDSVSYDLIYGLPLQTPQSFAATIDSVLELSPDRIALYNYAHLPTRFSSQRQIDRMQLPSADQKLALLCATANTLQQHGYHYIGMDHFVRDHDEMHLASLEKRLHRGFQGYSVTYAPETIGLGVSAISSMQHCYAQNHKTLDDYYDSLDKNRLPIARGLSLNADDELRREVINTLICDLALDIAKLEARHAIKFEQYFAAAIEGLLQAQADGLLEYSPNLLKVNEKGRLFLRNICMLFDNYLDNSNKHFSKTI
jgi:oxygen-independent coproporphyrinogen-3 oxidase